MRHTLSIGQRQIPKMNVFILPLTLLLLADSIMSYLFPIFTEQTLKSNTIMGLVVGFSSLIGFLFDMIASKLFNKQSWGMMILLTIAGAIMFPVTTYIGIKTSHLVWFLVASGVWGMYFEFLFFSAQDFIVSEEPKSFFLKDQGILASLWQLTSIIGPIIGGLLLTNSTTQFVLVVVMLQIISFVIYIVFFPHEARKEILRNKKQAFIKISTKQNAKLTMLYIYRLLPLFILGLSNSLVSSFFLTVGGLFGKQLANNILPAWLLIIIFSTSGIIATLTMPFIKIHAPKHIVAIKCLLLSGIALAFFAFLKHPYAIFGATAMIGFFLLVSYVLVDVSYEEIGKRAGKNELSVFSVARVAASCAFIIGPIMAGYLSDLFSYRWAGTLWGIMIIIIALGLLHFSPNHLQLEEKNT